MTKTQQFEYDPDLFRTASVAGNSNRARFSISDITRYGVYLQRSANQPSFSQITPNPDHIDTYDEWIPLYKCIKVKAVALAQRGEDLQLSFAEYWSSFFLFQLFCALKDVVTPRQSCYPLFRIYMYFFGYLGYPLILYWILMNTRCERVYSWWAVLIRIPLMAVAFFQTIFVVSLCPMFGSQFLSIFMTLIASFFLLYIEAMISSEDSRKHKVHTALYQAYMFTDTTIALVFGLELILSQTRRLVGNGYVLAFSGVICQLLLTIETVARGSLKKVIVQLLVLQACLKGIILIAGIVAMLRIAGDERLWNTVGGLGICYILSGMVNILLYVQRICQVSTDLLVEYLNDHQDDAEGDEDGPT